MSTSWQCLPPAFRAAQHLCHVPLSPFYNHLRLWFRISLVVRQRCKMKARQDGSASAPRHQGPPPQPPWRENGRPTPARHLHALPTTLHTSTMAALLQKMLQLPQTARHARGMAVKASAVVSKKELAAAVMTKHPKLFANQGSAEEAVKAVLDSIVDNVASGEGAAGPGDLEALPVVPTPDQ